MAEFRGTLKEFNDFIGPIARNIVCNMARNLKKHTTCRHEGCNKRKPLEAAHIKGKERPQIIADILSEYQVENKDFFIVNLYEFKAKFIEAHTPIDDVILPMCKEHHLLYDKENEIKNEYPILIEDSEDSNYSEEELIALENEEYEALESEMKKVVNSKVLKAEICKELGLDMNQTAISAISTANDLWNFDVSKSKFKKDFTFIFYNQSLDSYDTILIKKNTLDTNLFPEKNKKVIRFYVDQNFVDRTGFKFK